MRFLFCTFFFLLEYAHIHAQSNVRLDHYIDSLFQAYNNPNSPGIAVSVIEKGSVVTRGNFGMANLEHKAAFTHDTPVRMGYSGAREFMCAGLAIMEAEGLLHFTDKVKTYFPKLPAWSESVTIQDLLNHSSGFDDEWATMLLMQADMDNRVDQEQLLTMLYRQPKPQVEPGKGYMYSNSDFALLRWIMEIAAKQPLPAYLKQKLFAPLGMSSTFMNDFMEQLIPGLADKYYGQGNYFKSVGVKTSPGGNYRIVTTAADLEKWALALEDTNSVVSKAFYRLYKDARPIPVLAPEMHYLFGHEWHIIDGAKVIKHGGVNHDFYMTRIPSKQITIIGLGNIPEVMARSMNITNLWLRSKKTVLVPPGVSGIPVSVKPDKLAGYTGRYFQLQKPGHSSHIPNIVFYDIKLHGDSLHFYYSGNQSFYLLPVGDDLFKDPDYGAVLQIRKPHPDSSMGMQVWPTDGSEVMTFVRKDILSVHSVKSLEKFTGQYHSTHLDFYCRIVLDDNNRLVMRRPTISDKELIAYGENRFLFEMEAGDGGWYAVAEFTTNKYGKVDGFNVQHVRLMHHRFDKVR